MSSFIEVNGIKIEVKRFKSKTIRVRVLPGEGNVVITAPKYTTLREIKAFAVKYTDWIKEQQNNAFKEPSKAELEPHREELRKKTAVLLEKWEGITGLKSSGFTIRYMTSRWGSCCPSNRRISINLRLALKEEPFLDYVVLHEVIHLKYADHGPNFKAELDRYMPNWREIQKKYK